MNSAKIGILEKTDKVGLRSLLKGHDCGALEAKIGLEILSDLTDETLEGKLADEEIRRLLELADFTKSDGSGPVAMGLLDASWRRGADLRAALVASCLRGALPPVDLRAVCLVRAIVVDEVAQRFESWVAQRDDAEFCAEGGGRGGFK